MLIRHAESVAPGAADFDEYTRPLTAKGFRDAERLADSLASTRIDAAYASPYIRARQTIEPIAKARGLTIETIDDESDGLPTGSEFRSFAHRNVDRLARCTPGPQQLFGADQHDV